MNEKQGPTTLQHLITASSRAVVEGYQNANETTIPTNDDRLDAFSMSLYDRGAALGTLKNAQNNRR